MDRLLGPLFTQQVRGAYNEMSQDFIQDKLRETMSRSKAVTKKNFRGFESDSKRSDIMSERNLVTERFKPNHNAISNLEGDMMDVMSMPDNHQERTTVAGENQRDSAQSQSIPRLVGLKNSLVTKTQDNGNV